MKGHTAPLFPRQRQIVELLLQGCDNAEIARQLNMARRTVKAHFQPFISTLRHHRWRQASKTRNLVISEASMSGSGLYGNRIPTERERRVIELVAKGLRNKDVADAMGKSENMVKNYLRVIYDKRGLWNRVELALWYESRRSHLAR